MHSANKRLIITTLLESASVAIDEKDINENTRFAELGVDSISMLAIFLKLQEQLNLDLTRLGDQIEAPTDIKDLFDLVGKLQGNNWVKS